MKDWAWRAGWITLCVGLSSGCIVKEGARLEEEELDRAWGHVIDAHLRPYDAGEPPLHDAGEPPLHDAGEPPPCPPPPPLEDCFSGFMFAECPGYGEPTLFCEDEGPGGDCLWFSEGCPAEGFERRCGAGEVGTPGCTPFEDWLGIGKAPWDRERAMNVSVEVSPAPSPEHFGLHCEECALVPGADAPSSWPSGSCGPEFIGRDLCRFNEATIRKISYSKVENVGPGGPFSQTINFTFTIDWIPGGLEPLYGLLFEIDLERHLARACIIEAPDPTHPEMMNPDYEPLCADAGEIALSADTFGSSDTPTGRFWVAFPSYAPPPYDDAPPFVRGLLFEGLF